MTVTVDTKPDRGGSAIPGQGPRNCLEPPSLPSAESKLTVSLPAPCWLWRLFSALRWAHALSPFSLHLRPTGQPGPLCSCLPWGSAAHRHSRPCGSALVTCLLGPDSHASNTKWLMGPSHTHQSLPPPPTSALPDSGASPSTASGWGPCPSLEEGEVAHRGTGWLRVGERAPWPSLQRLRTWRWVLLGPAGEARHVSWRVPRFPRPVNSVVSTGRCLGDSVGNKQEQRFPEEMPFLPAASTHLLPHFLEHRPSHLVDNYPRSLPAPHLPVTQPSGHPRTCSIAIVSSPALSSLKSPWGRDRSL